MLHNFKSVVGKFLFYYLKENFYKVALEGGAKSTVDSLRMPLFLNFPVVLPSIDEQSKIISFIDCEIAISDALTEEANKVIEILQERRIALISAAVTGKIDVRGLVKGRKVAA